MTVLTLVNVIIFSLAAYGAVHHMESAAFCGTTCHTTMEPEYTAYQVGAHAKVACVSCHVGPGAEAQVEAKLAGTRQLWHLVTGRVPTPVPAPVRSMRPARDTCANCHWPEKMHGDTLRQIRGVRQRREELRDGDDAAAPRRRRPGRIRQRHPLAHEPRQPHRVHRHRSGAPDDSVGEADRCERPGHGVRRRRHHPRTARGWRAPRDGLHGLP